MEVNATKRELMVINGTQEDRNLISVSDACVKHTGVYWYLGSYITDDSKNDVSSSRTCKAEAQARSEVCNPSSTQSTICYSTLRNSGISCLVYGAETILTCDVKQLQKHF